jgi:serine/threonine protein kinase
LAELDAGDPQQIGSYALLGRLGSGGMGQVFLGRSQGGRLVAVKVIHAHLASDPAFRARFAREVASARKVSGMFTAPVVDAELDGPAPWLVTAYVPGPSLSDAVAEHGPLTGASVAALAAGLAEGLCAIHAAGVIHRDLKPSNVLLAGDGPRIIDFGIASAAEATALTGTGFMIGSPGFMSPEQAQGHPIGPASDIFSLAAVIAFAATGTGPFGTGDSAALLYRVVHGKPDLSHVSGPLGALLRRSLAKNPARRPTAPQFLTELTGAYPATPAFAGDWLPRQALTPPTPTPAPQAATADPAPSAPAPSGPAPSGPAQAAPPQAAPPQVPPPPAASPRRRLRPWMAAAAAAGAAVIVTLVISLTPGHKPGTPPATAAGNTSTARPQTTSASRSSPAPPHRPGLAPRRQPGSCGSPSFAPETA